MAVLGVLFFMAIGAALTILAQKVLKKIKRKKKHADD